MKKVAVIGVGKWGKNHLRTFHALDAAWGFADANNENRSEQSKLFPDLPTFSSVDDIIKADKADAVVIATPAESHFSIAKKALEAGLDVFIEKPITLNVEKGIKLGELAQKKKCIVMVGHLLLYHPVITKMKTLIAQGEFGETHYLYTQRVNLGVIRRHENAMWSLAPHDISIALHLFESKPVKVSTVGNAFVQADRGIEDVVFLSLQFPDGKLANIHASWLDPHKIRKVTLVGKEKMAIFDDMERNEKLRLFNKYVEPSTEWPPVETGQPIPINNGEMLSVRIENQKPPLTLEAEHFLHCIETREEPLTDWQNGVDVLRILEAATRSLKQGGEVITLS